jgi:hypothetical protein
MISALFARKANDADACQFEAMASGDLSLITLSRVGSFGAGCHGAFTMQKLLTFLVALAAIAFAVGSPAHADCVAIPGIPGCASYYPPPAAAGPTYTFLGSTDTYVTSGTRAIAQSW